MTLMLSKRLLALEAARTELVIRLSPTEREEAAGRYEATLCEPEESDPRAVAYWTAATLPKLASDYDAMLKDAPAPWLT